MGTYDDPDGLGEITVELEDDKLWATLAGVRSEMVQAAGHRFSVNLSQRTRDVRFIEAGGRFEYLVDRSFVAKRVQALP